MIPFAMIVSDKLGDSLSKMALAERNQSIETLPFDRADEALGVAANDKQVSRLRVSLGRCPAIRRREVQASMGPMSVLTSPPPV